ncbi:hypothetical protein PQ478_12895 [Alkalihalophilus pseudofirmus]|uniref:hypothetical protein n=1 Tax=Alkalihalophilus pseudofirmus TaxID=79885 RepID=UPI00259AF780|nr:hypothetical protein [Alkalihalophilus pseudofirmus]WEG15433.1 hypothetical protein PQ478_12895 [Alkalihalophilus pseudofirmus]
MINFDKKNRQLLTDACFSCSDPHFRRPIADLPQVGCCSYSPVFTLFELAKMAQSNPAFYFNLLKDEHAMIFDYTICVHAFVHPVFFEVSKHTSLSSLEFDDLKTSYSVCRYFEDGKGCTLPPSFKNAVCRSFICTTVEESLTTSAQEELASHVKDIHVESWLFNKKHQAVLTAEGYTLKDHSQEIFTYLKSISTN